MTKNRVTNMTDDEAKLMFDLVLRKAVAEKSTILEYDPFNHNREEAEALRDRLLKAFEESDDPSQ